MNREFSTFAVEHGAIASLTRHWWPMGGAERGHVTKHVHSCFAKVNFRNALDKTPCHMILNN